MKGIVVIAAVLLSLVFAASSSAATTNRCCNAFKGPLANNFGTVKTQYVHCANGRAIARWWLRECNGEPVCYVSGFACRYRETGVESASIRCRRRERLVTFATGA